MYEQVKSRRRGYGADSFWTDENAAQSDTSVFSPEDWGEPTRTVTAPTLVITPDKIVKASVQAATMTSIDMPGASTKWLLLAGVAVLLLVTKKPRKGKR